MIAYVCTNYNSSIDTVRAISSLQSAGSSVVKIVVVDNRSDLCEVEILRSFVVKNSNVDLILADENLGYFGGLNLGLDHTRHTYPHITWFVVGNNDLEFPADFIATVESMKEKLAEYPVISPNIVTLGGQHQNPHVISQIGVMRELMYDVYHSNYYLGSLIKKVANLLPALSRRQDETFFQNPQFIYQGHGSCYLLGPRFFDFFSKLWSPVFMMHEEFFLAKQLNDVGFKIFYEPKITVVHRVHGSLGKVPSRARWEMSRDAHRHYRRYVKPW